MRAILLASPGNEPQSSPEGTCVLDTWISVPVVFTTMLPVRNRDHSFPFPFPDDKQNQKSSLPAKGNK